MCFKLAAISPWTYPVSVATVLGWDCWEAAEGWGWWMTPYLAEAAEEMQLHLQGWESRGGTHTTPV